MIAFRNQKYFFYQSNNFQKVKVFDVRLQRQVPRGWIRPRFLLITNVNTILDVAPASEFAHSTYNEEAARRAGLIETKCPHKYTRKSTN